MRYLDKLLEGANNFKKIRFAVDKAKDAGHRADKQQGKYLDRLTSKGKFSTDDKKQSDTLDRMRDAEEVEDRAIKMANKLVPRVHKKGGGKGDGKPRGKLRLVQSAFYQQVGHLIAEITYSRRDARILKGRQELKDAEKLDKAASAAMDSKEREGIFPEKEWTDKLKAKKIITNKKKQINARRETTREKSQ